MAQTAAAKARQPEAKTEQGDPSQGKYDALPRSATITIRNQHPHPSGEVEVTPNAGRIHFRNADKKEYRLRLRPVKNDSGSGIDLLLPKSGSVTVLIRVHDAFVYTIGHVRGHDAETGPGGGPIKN